MALENEEKMEGVSTESKQKEVNENNGRLSKLLKASLDKTIEKYLHCAKYMLFAENFAAIHKKHNNDLATVHQQFISKLESSIREEIKLMYQEETINTYLNKLDDLIMKAGSNQKSCKWRPSGNPETDLMDHLHVVKEEHKKELEQILAEQTEDIENLTQTVYKERQNLLSAIEDIKNKYGDYKEEETKVIVVKQFSAENKSGGIGV
ncbi:uncharacterized protein LOC111624793 [Centruroides sculpturatus]|uniref:uncharacterized protein LOC111624793 n=1 Tax=Centruroides sculpturatus TaxID=218467 RepID=UPI000C6E9DA5|nr:uncharacterized protein LOC111624793 [Centruroides sculpturatus]